MRSVPFRRALATVSAACLVAAGMVIGTATSASAATISVPTDHATIAAAVAAASTGDTINIDSGTFTEDVTVPAGKSLTLTGAGPGATTIVGEMTLNSPSTVSQVTLQGSDTTVPYSSTPLSITATGAGSLVENNTVTLGQRGIYIDGAVGTAADHTVVQNNDFLNTGYSNTGAVWINKSEYVDVLNNTFTNDTPTGGVGVNLVGGSSNILIDTNTFTDFGNALVLIANSSGFPSTPQAHDITFSGNTVTDAGTALYIGGNNIIDVNIAGNNITGGTTAILITPGYSSNPTAWLESSNRPLQRFIIEDNHFDGMDYGFTVSNLSQLDNDETVTLVSNEFCTVTIAAVNNAITDSDRSVRAIDNNFCDRAVLGEFDTRDTPAGAGAGDATLAATGVETAEAIGLVSGGAVLLAVGVLLLVTRRRLRLQAAAKATTR